MTGSLTQNGVRYGFENWLWGSRKWTKFWEWVMNLGQFWRIFKNFKYSNFACGAREYYFTTELWQKGSSIRYLFIRILCLSLTWHETLLGLLLVFCIVSPWHRHLFGRGDYLLLFYPWLDLAWRECQRFHTLALSRYHISSNDRNNAVLMIK